MKFCDECGSAMVNVNDEWMCKSCDENSVQEATTSVDPTTPTQRPASLTNLSTTDSGSVRKQDAMEWLDSLDEPTDRELQNAFLAKPSDFSGSTYPTSISNIRITGDPKFVETIAGLLKPIQNLENSQTRVEMNLQKTEDRDTDELTGNYALYLSIAQRG
jgi:DNA-directed RNA polymerase subunit M/transcription elongation factor TFIIS